MKSFILYAFLLFSYCSFSQNKINNATIPVIAHSSVTTVELQNKAVSEKNGGASLIPIINEEQLPQPKLIHIEVTEIITDKSIVINDKKAINSKPVLKSIDKIIIKKAAHLEKDNK